MFVCWELSRYWWRWRRGDFHCLAPPRGWRFSQSAVSCNFGESYSAGLDAANSAQSMSAAYRPEGTPRTLARARAAACPPGSACLCAPRSLLVPLVSVPAAGRDAPVSPPRTSDRAGVTRPRRRNVIDPLSYAQQADPGDACAEKKLAAAARVCTTESETARAAIRHDVVTRWLRASSRRFWTRSGYATPAQARV